MHQTKNLLATNKFPKIFRNPIETLQMNLGYLCNQSCNHCHVNAGPNRTEMMTLETIEQVLQFAKIAKIRTLDLTGGAPEMNPHFKDLVQSANSLGIKVIDRCNLTILEEPGYEDLISFLAVENVEIVASLPCYLEENVDKQRGQGVFQASLAALKKLNQMGFGLEDSPLKLNLVFNPQWPVLPPNQIKLELAYKKHLLYEYDIEFNRLFVITNMPIQRFGSMLISQGRFEEYLELLLQNYRPENLENLMCLSTISIDWQGFLYDCDFNQMLAIPLAATGKNKTHISNFSLDALHGAPIATGAHCFGCTAGQGSSCGGALEKKM